jgi:hypothetical protein
MKLTHLSDAEVLSGIRASLASERSFQAKMIAYLAEIDERRLALQAAYSSLFNFCIRALKLSEGEAFRRINAARLFKRRRRKRVFRQTGSTAARSARAKEGASL